MVSFFSSIPTPHSKAMQRVHKHMPPYSQPLPPSMATIGLSSITNLSKKPCGHHRRNSGELDVFEAARYFSGDVEGLTLGLGACTERRSLEIPMQALPHPHVPLEKQQLKEKKRKPPSSPAAKLAGYLNSLLLQKAPKRRSKNRSNIPTTLSLKGDYENEENYSRGRRSRSIGSCDDSKSMYNYSTNGFGTPSLHHQNNKNSSKSIDVFGESGDRKFCRDWFYENKWVPRKDMVWAKELKQKGRKGPWQSRDRTGGEDDKGSDSSSDLFELPVYGKTDKRSAVIACVLGPIKF